MKYQFKDSLDLAKWLFNNIKDLEERERLMKEGVDNNYLIEVVEEKNKVINILSVPSWYIDGDIGHAILLMDNKTVSIRGDKNGVKLLIELVEANCNKQLLT